ncbi:MAG TPA: VWA domain-containing protein [Candidatus Acidoferrum sp.]|nr:VWA domain-containing protein [Candidatus Acidoferrum sp.]
MRFSKKLWRKINVPLVAIPFAGLILAWGAMDWAQEQKAGVPSPAVRVTVRLVLADAVVTDKDGKTITGLGAQDFTVLEDGKPQKVTIVSFEQPAETARALRSQRATLPPNVTTNRPEYRMPLGVPVILLLDALNTQLRDQARVRMEMLKYLDTQLQPGQPVAVYTLGRSLRLLQDFTDDTTLVKAAVESFNPAVSLELQLSDVDARLPRLSGARADAAGVRAPNRDAAVFISRMADFYNEQANLAIDMRVGMTLTTFRAIAQAVAGLPGRKNLIWVSGSFPIATYTRIIKYSADGDNDPNRVAFNELYEDRVRETTSALTDAQVAVYPVDARGLVGQLLGGAENQGVSGAGTLVGGAEYAQNLQLASGALQESQATMKQVAGETGGKVFINQNDLEHAVALSMVDGASYYLLGYSPEGKPDGKFHKIEVKVNRPGVTVRARHGYYALTSADDAKTTKQREGEIGIAMQIGTPAATGVTFDARVVPPPPAAKMKVGIDFIVDPYTISAEDAGGGNRRLAVEFHAAAYGSDRKIAGQKDVAIKPTLKSEDFTRIQQQGLPYHLDLELPPAHYTLRLGVVDQRSGFIGTADMPLALEGNK